jgi:hypothetical protein
MILVELMKKDTLSIEKTILSCFLPLSKEAYFDYRLENDPEFLKRIEQARRSLRAGKGIKLENLT